MDELFSAPFWEARLLGLSVLELATALAILFAFWFLARIVVRFLTTAMRLYSRRRGVAYENTLYARLRGPIIILIIMVGAGLALNSLPFIGYLATWRWYVYFAVLGGVGLWALLRIFVGVADAGSLTGFQVTLVSRMTLLAYLILTGFVLLLQAIQWPIWCIPNCTAVNINNAQLVGMNLRDTDFVEADLTGANLSGANLSNSDLSGAKLSDVNLQGAKLNGASMVGADLRRADLRNADLRNADLRGANLTQANLTQSDLTRLLLEGADLSNTTMTEVNLSGLELRGTRLINASLTGANLRGASLVGARLSGANLSGADLSDADLSGAYANMANLGNADLMRARLSGTSLIGTRLSSANLQEARMEGAVLLGAILSGADLSGAILTGVQMFPAEFVDDSILRIDNVLASLNALQRSQVVVTTSVGGVVFDETTVWPPSKQVLLLDRLGQQLTLQAETEDATVGLILNPGPDPRTVRLRKRDFSNIRGPRFAAGDPALRPASQVIADMFTENGYPGPITLEATSNEDSLERLCRASIDFAYTTRNIRADERALCDENNVQPLAVRIGTGTSLVVVVNPLNTFVQDLSVQDLREALTLTRWSDVNPNFPPEPIARYLPEPGSDAYNLLVDIIFAGEALGVLQAGNTLFDSNNANLVWDAAGEVNAIAVVDFDYYLSNQAVLRAVSLAGIAPTLENVEGPNYLLVRPALLYANLIGVQQNFAVNTFLAYYLDQSLSIMSDFGFTPLSTEAVDRELRRYLLRVGGVLE